MLMIGFVTNRHTVFFFEEHFRKKETVFERLAFTQNGLIFYDETLSSTCWLCSEESLL